jgi:nucleotide-binding universal stress UspA family protein
MFHPKVILHPTDYSECAQKAFQVAIEMAANYQARLILLHVAVTLGPETVSFGEAVSELQPEGHRHRLQDELDRALPSVGLTVDVERLLTEGDPGAEVVRVAGERHCDLIVLGTHGRRGLQRFFTGSVTEKVIRLAPCPVLSVRLSCPQ